MKDSKEILAKLFFLICSMASILSLGIIMFFIFAKGLPAIYEIGVTNFIFGQTWAPSENLYGIFPMIITSILVTICSFIIAALIGTTSALYLAFYANDTVYKIVKPMIDLLAGIPSVVYGFFGVMVIVPFIRNNLGGPGKSMLAGIVVLVIIVLPTIISLSETAFRAVPTSYYEGAISLGTTHNEAVFKVVLPAAKSGVTTSYILGIGRALGETMAIILVAGNTPQLTLNPLDPVRTLTTGIALEMGYAAGLHQAALFGIGAILFIAIFILNLILAIVKNKEV